MTENLELEVNMDVEVNVRWSWLRDYRVPKYSKDKINEICFNQNCGCFINMPCAT